MIMSDKWIREMSQSKGMIEPFIPNQVKYSEGNRIISYGLSGFGYDIRLANEFKRITNLNTGVIDPKAFDGNHVIDYVGDVCIIPPNSFVLGRSLERIRVPRDVLVICIGKSTYARCGIIANVTPLEPEWEGYITLELSNTTNLPARVYANEGIVQLLFLKGDQPCEISYADRDGKYQNQVGVVPPRL